MMNLEGTHALSKTALAMIFMFGACACLPDIEPQTEKDGGSGGGDTGPVDTGSDQGADAEVDADASASCTDVPPEDCVAMEPGSYCGDDGVPFECSVTDSGCVIKTVLSCEDQEFCEDGSCKACDEVAGCTAVGDLTCTDSFEPAVCARDGETNCFILDVADICPVSSSCEAGMCRSCEALGNACDVDGTTRCDPELVEGNLRTVEKCAEVNGCQVYVPDADLQCPLGETCAGEGRCESCHDPLCEVDGVVDAAAAQCPDPAAPRAIERCVVDDNGCLKEKQEECPEATYCAADTGNASCEDCSSLSNSCDTMMETRCGATNNIETCRPDSATGCLVWESTKNCVDSMGPFGGVCVPAGGVDPTNGGAITQTACLDNECSSPNLESCSAEGDVQTCTSDSTTGLKYLVVTSDCIGRQSCEDRSGVIPGKECVCAHECELGDEECLPGTDAGQYSRVTQICETSSIDTCRVFVPDDRNPCNSAAVFTGGGVGCDAAIGDDSILRCVESAADMCRRPKSDPCPCGGTILCGQEQCADAPSPFSDGTLRFICE